LPEPGELANNLDHKKISYKEGQIQYVTLQAIVPWLDKIKRV